MMAQGTQKKLERVRPPRVSITYEVETGGAIELKERKFVEVNPDNFDTVLKSAQPRLQFTTENKLQPDGSKIAVELKFESLEDFSPDRVAEQVKPLRELLELRTKLADLRGRLQGNDKLEEILQQTLNDAESMRKLRAEIARGAADV